MSEFRVFTNNYGDRWRIGTVRATVEFQWTSEKWVRSLAFHDANHFLEMLPYNYLTEVEESEQ